MLMYRLNDYLLISGIQTGEIHNIDNGYVMRHMLLFIFAN